MRIGIDLDGCVYDYVDAVRRYAVAEYDVDPRALPDPDQWAIWESWGITREQFIVTAQEGIAAGVVYGTGDPCPGALDALDDLAAAGHSLHIVTARSGHYAVGLTAAWLAEHEVPHASLTFAADKTVVPVDMFVEDNVRNAEAINAAGGRAILLDRPYNRHATLPRRAANWTAAVALIETANVDTGPGPVTNDSLILDAAEAVAAAARRGELDELVRSLMGRVAL